MKAGLSGFEQRQGRRAEAVHFCKIFGSAISLGQIAVIKAFLRNDLEVGMVKPVTVFMEIPDKGKGFSGGKMPAQGWKFFPVQMAVKTVKRLKIRTVMKQKNMGPVIAVSGFISADGNPCIQRGAKGGSQGNDNIKAQVKKTLFLLHLGIAGQEDLPVFQIRGKAKGVAVLHTFIHEFLKHLLIMDVHKIKNG